MLPRMGWVDVFGEDALGGAGETGVVPPPAGPAEGLVDGDDVDVVPPPTGVVKPPPELGEPPPTAGGVALVLGLLAARARAAAAAAAAAVPGAGVASVGGGGGGGGGTTVPWGSPPQGGHVSGAGVGMCAAKMEGAGCGPAAPKTYSAPSSTRTALARRVGNGEIIASSFVHERAPNPDASLKNLLAGGQCPMPGFISAPEPKPRRQVVYGAR